MPIEVHSPYSGKLVKVRSADVGRAIRDEQGNVFYVVANEDGAGYYASKTRAGSEQDRATYEALVLAAGGEGVSAPAGGEAMTGGASAAAAAAASGVAGGGATGEEAYDATGRRSLPMLRVVVVLLILLIAIVLIVYGCEAMFGGSGAIPATGAPNSPGDVSPTQPGPSAVPEPQARAGKDENGRLKAEREQAWGLKLTATVPGVAPGSISRGAPGGASAPSFRLPPSSLSFSPTTGARWPVAA